MSNLFSVASPSVPLGPCDCLGKSVERPSESGAAGLRATHKGIRDSLKVRQQSCASSS